MITVDSSGKIYNLTLDNFVILPNKWLCYWHKCLGVSCWAPLLLTWVTWVGFQAKVLPAKNVLHLHHQVVTKSFSDMSRKKLKQSKDNKNSLLSKCPTLKSSLLGKTEDLCSYLLIHSC